ncbi:MAG: Wadjet anti-phage system protein JetA family protein [Ruminiclostridium sp.]
MDLYDVIPENLFSILASKNKGLYVKSLFVLLDAFKQHLKIAKDELISMISAKLDDDIIAADFSDEDLLENERSVSGKAHFLVRRLKSVGWILIETENDFKEYVTVPGFSYKIIQLLYDIANVSDSENFAYVYSTYSSLKMAQGTHDPFEMVTALKDGAERTEKLVESLKSVYHSITYYNQQLINTLNINNVLYSHYEVFQEEVVSRILRPLKIKDSVPKYKMPIQLVLKTWLSEDNTVEEMARYLSANQNDVTLEECRNDILRNIHYIIDVYENLDKDFINPIDRKNRQYTKATTLKIDYLINSDQTVKGNLISLLKLLSYEKFSDDVCGCISDALELYELSYVNDESLHDRRRVKRRTRNSELIMSEDSVDFKIKARAMAMQIMNNKYSKKKVAAFVEGLLGDKSEITTREFDITDDDTYIMTLLSVVQADDKNSNYTIDFTDDIIKSGSYEIPYIVYKRRIQK